MKTQPGRHRYGLSLRFERAVRRLPPDQQRWLLARLRTPGCERPDRDFWILDVDSGRWRRL